ncbi:MAG: hypothetical protein ABIC91_04060 [Nanoarchaeota archaeon]
MRCIFMAVKKHHFGVYVALLVVVVVGVVLSLIGEIGYDKNIGGMARALPPESGGGRGGSGVGVGSCDGKYSYFEYDAYNIVNSVPSLTSKKQWIVPYHKCLSLDEIKNLVGRNSYDDFYRIVPSGKYSMCLHGSECYTWKMSIDDLNNKYVIWTNTAKPSLQGKQKWVGIITNKDDKFYYTAYPINIEGIGKNEIQWHVFPLANEDRNIQIVGKFGKILISDYYLKYWEWDQWGEMTEVRLLP